MTTLHPARSVFALALLGVLSGCATGSSLSISQAPLSFVLTEDGAYEIGAQQDGTVQALAERGDITNGVPGYDVLGGNALLPVSAVTLTPVSTVGALGPGLVSVAAIPGQATADLAGQVNIAVAANNSGVSLAGSAAVPAPISTVVAPASGLLTTPAVTVAATTPPVAPATTTVMTTATQPLTAVSSILGGAAPPIAPAATAPNNPILATLAAALGKRCC